MNMPVQSYQNLIVWRRAVALVHAVYEISARFPREETYGLSAQMKRAAVSIPSNIAEGSKRGTRKDYRHFLLNAYGSGAELETQILIAKTLPFGSGLNFTKIDSLLDETMRMLNAMTSRL